MGNKILTFHRIFEEQLILVILILYTVACIEMLQRGRVSERMPAEVEGIAAGHASPLLTRHLIAPQNVKACVVPVHEDALVGFGEGDLSFYFRAVMNRSLL